MKVAIVQPYFLPYLAYFQLLNIVDQFIIYDDVNFMKKKWINRNNILINGEPKFFTIPLKKVSQNKYIKDIEIVDDLDWKSKFLRKVELAYKKAPHYQKSFDLLEKIINQKHSHISELAFSSLKELCNHLNIQTKIKPSATVYNNSQLKGQDRIIDICKKEGASHYINPIGGTSLYSKESFSRSQIQLNFLKPDFISYRQFKNKFIPNLSILDTIMFNDLESIHNFLKCFKLI